MPRRGQWVRPEQVQAGVGARRRRGSSGMRTITASNCKRLRERGRGALHRARRQPTQSIGPQVLLHHRRRTPARPPQGLHRAEVRPIHGETPRSDPARPNAQDPYRHSVIAPTVVIAKAKNARTIKSKDFMGTPVLPNSWFALRTTPSGLPLRRDPQQGKRQEAEKRSPLPRHAGGTVATDHGAAFTTSPSKVIVS